MELDPEKQYAMVPCGTVRLHYVERGRGSLLLLLHGFPEFWWSWRHQIPVLSRHYRVVALDMRGYNYSEKPIVGYDVATLARDIRDVIDHFGGPAYVAAHYWGGGVAYQLAMDWPERVRSLAVLNAPHPDAWIRAWLTYPEQQRKSWYVFMNLLPDLSEQLYQQQFASRTSRLATVIRPEDVAIYERAFNRPGVVATAAINYYRELVRDIARRRSITPPRITCPVRVLWGRRDVALDPAVNDMAAQWIDNFEIYDFPKCKHWLACERPRAVNRHLREHFVR